MSTTVVHRRPPVRCCVKCCPRKTPSKQVYYTPPVGSVPTKPYHWPRKEARWTTGTSFYYQGWRYYSTNATMTAVATEGYVRYDLMCQAADQLKALSDVLHNELLPAYPISCGNNRVIHIRMHVTAISQPTVVSFHDAVPPNENASMLGRAFAAIVRGLFGRRPKTRQRTCSPIDVTAQRLAVKHGAVLSAVRDSLQEVVDAELADNLGCHRWHVYKDVLTNLSIESYTRQLLPDALRVGFRPCACRNPQEDFDSWPYECVRVALETEMRCRACRTYQIGTVLPCRHRICCKCAVQNSSWWQTNDACLGKCPMRRCRREFTAVRRIDLNERASLERRLARRIRCQ